MRWQLNEILKQSTVGASKTDEPISYEALVGADPNNLIVDVVVSDVVVGSGAGVSAALQQLIGDTWVAFKTSAITAIGVVSFTAQQETDADDLPLRERIRVVATTASDASLEVSAINLYRLEG